jgi:hypothetical protein
VEFLPNNLIYSKETTLMNYTSIQNQYRLGAMVLLLCLSAFLSVAQTTYLDQNFTGPGPYTSTTPTSAQFDTILVSSPTILRLIPRQGYVEFERTVSSSGGSGRIVRSTDFSPIPSTLYYQVRINIPSTNLTTTANVATFSVGQGIASVNTIVPDSNLFAKFSINFVADDSYRLSRTTVPTATSNLITGSVLVTWVMNNLPTRLKYRTPNNTIDSINAKCFDLWIGTTRFLQNSGKVSTQEVSLTDILFRFQNGIGIIRLSDFLIRDVDGILPVNLTYFNAQAAGGQVGLAWETAWEQNSREFIVQRSTDLKEFGDIGKVAAMGQTDERQAYRFTDSSPAMGANYYRLRIVDEDGSYEYSKVKDVINRPNEPVLLVSPNPVSNRTIRLRTFMLENSSLKLSNILGQDISFKTNDMGNNTVELIPLSTLSPGLYIVSAQRDGIRVHSQLIIP